MPQLKYLPLPFAQAGQNVINKKPYHLVVNRVDLLLRLDIYHRRSTVHNLIIIIRERIIRGKPIEGETLRVCGEFSLIRRSALRPSPAPRHSSRLHPLRSEERRVGKECSPRWAPSHETANWTWLGG